MSKDTNINMEATRIVRHSLKKSGWLQKPYQKYFLVIVLLAVALRLFLIGNVPGNTAINQDEAYAGYDAWSLLHYGMDSWGYHMPVYMTTWGSGMSALQTYLMIPFVAVLGLTPLAIRLPQAIWGILSVLAAYCLGNEIRGKKFALTLMAFLAIVPWHVMISRWAYDCNYLPGCLLFAMLFLVKGSRKPYYLLLSAFFFGLSLYAYAASWIVAPFLILFSVLILQKRNYLGHTWELWVFFLIILVMAIPLVLFVLVNMGYIPEIRTPFLSIPKMPTFRSGDYTLSPKECIQDLYNTLLMLIRQEDSRRLNTIPDLGIYYKISIIPFGIGIIRFCYERFGKKNKEWGFDSLFLLQLLLGLALGALLKEPLIHRINIIHFPIIYFIAVGIYTLIEYYGRPGKYGATIVYGIALIMFCMNYFVSYDNVIAGINHDGIKQAVEFIDETPHDTVYVLGSGRVTDINFIHFVFWERIPTDTFVRTMQRQKNRVRFQGYEFDFSDYHDAPITSGNLYVCEHSNEEALEYMRDLGMTLYYFDNVTVGISR